jgi:uncharacterized protein
MEMQNKDFHYNRFQPKKGNEKEYTVIIFHGWGGRVQTFYEMAEEISKEGYTTIVPELIFHDSRSPLKNHFDKETMQKYFWQVIFNSIDEFGEFVDALNLEKKKLILIGSSMGGFIANGIYAFHQDIAGLVNVNGSGSFVLTEELFRKADNRDALSRVEIDVIKKYDPIGKDVSNSPVLLLHGDSDKVVPIEGQKQFYHYLLQNEKDARVTFHVHRNVNHEFTSEMKNEVIQWIKQIN